MWVYTFFFAKRDPFVKIPSPSLHFPLNNSEHIEGASLRKGVLSSAHDCSSPTPFILDAQIWIRKIKRQANKTTVSVASAGDC